MATYVIKPGDSLYKLAQRFGTTPQAIAQANGITNPGQILAGQTLQIPEWNGQSGFDGGRMYTVQPGDSLFTIGRRFGVTPHAIAQASGLPMNGYLYPGQTLRIPSSGPAPAPSPGSGFDGGRTYTVQPGDSLFTIGQRFGVTPQAIAQASGLAMNGYIYPGQTLKIPSSGGPAPAPVPPTSPISVPLSNVADTQFSFQQLWPHIQQASAKYGADAKVVAAIIAQESTFKNHRVHRDGTGHGLIGLDDHGRLPDFEDWSEQRFGRGRGAKSIPPALQIDYLAKTIAELTRKHNGNAFAAAREWHRGHHSVIWDAKGARYEGYIREHIRKLFG